MNDLVLLALLFDGPKRGYRLKREAGFTKGPGDMHNSLVYPPLWRFRLAGWVVKKAVAGAGKPASSTRSPPKVARNSSAISRTSTADRSKNQGARKPRHTGR